MNEIQSELDAISTAYGLAPLQFVSTPEKGISTKNIIAVTAEGDTYFIKKHKKGDLEKISNAEKAAQFIATYSNTPVLLPTPTSEGKAHAVIEEEAYSVFPYVHDSGRPESDGADIAHMKRLGAMLGMIHSASQKAALPDDVQHVPAWILESKEESLARFEKLRTLITAKSERDEYDEKALAFIDLKASLMDSVELESESHEVLAMCHGDYHQSNLLFNEQGEISAVCDWDISGVGNPYTELVRSFKMCVIGWKYKQLDTLWEPAAAFMEGYRSTCGYTIEVSKVETAIRVWYSKLLTQAWPLTDHYYLNHTKSDRSVDSDLNKLLFLRDDQKIFAQLITQGLR